MINSRKLEDLKPNAQEACKLFLDACEKQGLKVCITQTLRDAEYQNMLYQKGRTTSGGIVTNCDGYKNKSEHQTGLAWDICKNIKGQEYNDASFFKNCAIIAKQFNIKWGGDWNSFKDTPHFYIDASWRNPVGTIKEQDNDYLTAVDKLVECGVISSPKVWKDGTFTKNNVESLIIKFANKL